MQHISSLVAI